MNRKEVLFKRIKLSKEIEELNKIRESVSDSEKINKLMDRKRKQYNFYNNLLKKLN